MDLGAIGCLGVLLIPTHALDRDISNVCAYTLSQLAEEIVVLERIFGAKAPRTLPVRDAPKKKNGKMWEF